jgi:hypothetical protein
MDRRSMILGLVIALCIAVPVAGIGYAIAIDYTGTTQSAEQEVDVLYITLAINGGTYSQNFSKSILYTTEKTPDSVKYIPVNKAGTQVVETLTAGGNNYNCVSCGSVLLLLDGPGEKPLPEYTLSITNTGDIDPDANVLIRYKIGDEGTPTVVLYDGNFSVNVTGQNIPDRVTVEVLVGVDVNGCTEIPDDPLTNVTFEFEAGVTVDES